MGTDDKELCQMWLPQAPASTGLCENLIHIQVITMMPTPATCQYNGHFWNVLPASGIDM